MERQRMKLADSIALAIQKDIISGKYKIDEKLPNEFSLAEEMEVGRGTIREAVKILVSKNILYIKRGHGTFVAKNLGVSNDPLGLAFSHDRAKMALDIFEIRLLLEPEIAKLAAERGNADDLKVIKEKCEQVKREIALDVSHIDSDIEFHEAIAKATHNEIMAKIVPIIQDGVRSFNELYSLKLQDMTIVTHDKVVEAIEKKDAQGAYNAMYEHLEQNKIFIKSNDISKE